MPYASKTKVPVDQSRLEIERVAKRYGATEFASGWKSDGASVSFVVKDRMVRFTVPVPKNDDREVRRRWRAMLLGIKAKLECVASKIETFDEAFLAHVVTETGETVWERLRSPSSGIKLLAPAGEK